MSSRILGFFGCDGLHWLTNHFFLGGGIKNPWQMRWVCSNEKLSEKCYKSKVENSLTLTLVACRSLDGLRLLSIFKGLLATSGRRLEYDAHAHTVGN